MAKKATTFDIVNGKAVKRELTNAEKSAVYKAVNKNRKNAYSGEEGYTYVGGNNDASIKMANDVKYSPALMQLASEATRYKDTKKDFIKPNISLLTPFNNVPNTASQKFANNTTAKASASNITPIVKKNDLLTPFENVQTDFYNPSKQTIIDSLTKGDTSDKLRKLAAEYRGKAKMATYSPFPDAVEMNEDGTFDKAAVEALQDRQHAAISNPTTTTFVKSKLGNSEIKSRVTPVDKMASKIAEKKRLSETPSAYLEKAEHAEKMAKDIDEAYEYSKKHPVLGSAVSVATNALGSALTPIEVARQMINNPRGEIDYNAPAFSYTRQGTALRQGTKAAAKIGLQNRDINMIDDNGQQTLGANAVDFGVDTGMSIADVATVRGAATPLVGGIQSGLDVSSRAFLDAKDKGVNNNKAVAQGVAQGLAEAFFERYGLAGLKAFKTAPADSIHAIAKNITKQMVTEASEESATEISNIVTDAMIMGRDSDWEETYNSYMENGLAPKQALANTLYDMAKRVGVAGLGGAVSGGILGSGAQAINYKANSATGRAMRNSNQSFTANELKDVAGALNTDASNYNNADTAEQATSTKEYLEKLAEEVTKGKELTDAENGAAYNEIMTTAAKAANDATQGNDRVDVNSDDDIDFFNNALRIAKGKRAAQESEVDNTETPESVDSNPAMWNEGFEIPEDWKDEMQQSNTEYPYFDSAKANEEIYDYNGRRSLYVDTTPYGKDTIDLVDKSTQPYQHVEYTKDEFEQAIRNGELEFANKRTSGVDNKLYDPYEAFFPEIDSSETTTRPSDVELSREYIADHSRRYSNDEEAQSLYLEGYSGQDALDYDDALAAAYQAGRSNTSLRDAVESNSVLDGFYNRNMQLVEDMWVAGYKSRNSNSVRNSKGNYASTGDESDIKHYNLGTYNRYGWTKVNNILNKQNSAELLKAIGDIKRGYNVEQATDGSYMVEVASLPDGAKDTIIYTDGDYENPGISKVVKINIDNETEAREIKEAIYGTEQNTLDNSVIENLEAEGVLKVYDRRSSPSYKELQYQGYGRLREKSISANKGRSDGRGGSQNTGVSADQGRGSAVTKVLKWAHDKTGYDVKLDSGLKSAAQVDLKNHVISINPYASNLLGELSHELVHVFSRETKAQYNALHDTVIETLKADTSVDYDAMYAEYAKKYNSTDRDYIEEEIVADAAKGFLNDPEFARKVAKKDKSLAQRIADFFRDIADVLAKLAKSSNIGKAADALKANAKAYSDAAKAWYAAFEAVSNNKQTIEQSLSTSQKDALDKHGVAVEGDAVIRNSLGTFNATDKDALLDDLVYAGYDESQAKKWIKDVSSIAAIITKNPNLDYTAGEGTWLKPNAETIKTLDGSFMCPKKSLFQGTYNAVLEKSPNLTLDAEGYIRLKNLMSSKGYEVPCVYCYNESRVQNIGSYAKEFIEQNKDKVKLTNRDLTTNDGLAKLYRKHPEIYEAWLKFRQSEHGMQRSVKFDAYNTAYHREDIMTMSAEDRRAINNDGGLRWFAFSDFKTEQMIDCMQATLDLAAMNMKSYAYTKQENFVKVFGNTNIIINMSVAGRVENGKLVFNNENGMNITTAKSLRNRYSNTAGITLVGINDEHILAAMKADYIDMIIPFHRSGLSNENMRQLGISDYTDYQQSGDQNEHWLSDGKKCSSNLLISDYWSTNKSGKENAQRYLKECARTGREPKFSRFLDKKTDHSGRTVYALKADGSTDGYYKLLVDHKMYNNDGVGIVQQEVVPNFNMAAAKNILKSYEGNADSLPVAKDVVNEFIKQEEDIRHSYGEVDENKKYTVNELSAKSTVSDIKGTIKTYHPNASKEELGYASKGIREVLEATGSIQSRVREVQASDNRTSVHAGWGLNMGRHGSLRDGGGVKTVGLGITRRFVRKGYIDFRGQKLSSNPNEAIQELATMGMVFRNPSFETFRVFYTKGNKIVGSEAITSKLINASSTTTLRYGATNGEMAADYRKRMKRLGADGYYLMHNHPSGQTRASKEDVQTTAFFYHYVKGFKGHIIIDHNKYGLLDVDGNVTEDNPLLSLYEDNHQRVIDHPLLYADNASSPQEVAALGKDLVHNDTYSSLIYTDNLNRVVAVQEVHNDFLNSDNFIGYVANRKLDFGALRAFLVSTNRDAGKNKAMDAYARNVLDDIIVYLSKEPENSPYYSPQHVAASDGANESAERARKHFDYRGKKASEYLKLHVGEEASNGDQYSYSTLIAKEPMAMARVVATNVSMDRNVIVKEAQKDIKAVSKDNNNTIYVPDIQKDIVFGVSAVRHGLNRNKNNYLVAQKVGTILSNSIGINELEPRAGSPNGSYLLLGIARDEDDNVYPTLFNVKRNISKGQYQVDDIEVLSVYSTNSKKIETRARSTRASENSYTLTSLSTISIKDLLSIVKESHAAYLSDDVVKALGAMKKHDSEYGTDVKYSYGSIGNLSAQTYKELRNKIKHYTFHLPEGFKGEIDKLGGLRGLRREFFMTLNITKSKGIGIDTMWKELSELYPWLFDPEVTNPADQLEHIVDALRDARASAKANSLDQEEFDSYLRELETELREQGMSEDEIENYLDEVMTKQEEDAKKAKETTKKRGRKKKSNDGLENMADPADNRSDNLKDRVGKRAKEYEQLPQNLNESERDKRLKDLAEKYGVMPKGVTPLRDVTVPLKTSDDLNVRRFARTVLESNAINDDMAEELKQQILDEAMSYVAQSDAKAQQHATWAVDKNGIEYGKKTWDAVVNSTKVATKDDIAVGELLLKRYAEAGDTAMVMQMVAELASEGTRAGQVVQAMSMLKKMSDTNSPEGAAATILAIKKTVDKMNRDYRVRFKGKKNIPQIEIDERLVEKYLKAQSVEEREKALDELYNNLAKQVPNTVADKLNQWRYLAMLGNPRTHIRNIVGNAVFMPAIALKNEIATAMEATAQKAGKLDTRSKTIIVGKEYKAYAREDFDEVKELLSGQRKGDTKNEIMSRREAFGESKLAQPFNKIARWNSNALEAEDMLFLKHHYIKALSGWLQANNIDLDELNADAKLLAKARQYAINEAQKATYRDASDTAAALNQIARSGNRGLAMFIESVLPFKKTPINILKRGVEYSPVGLINGLTKQSIELRRGNITMNEWIDTIASGLTGTGIMILGMLLAKLGIITGAYSDDDKEKDMEKLMGKQEYAVNLFGYSYTIDWAAPSILPFMVGAEISAALDADEDYEFKDAVEALQKLGEPMTQLSMLSGLSDTLDNISYSNNKLTAMVFGSLTGYLGQFVPTFAGQVARTVDPVQRITYSDRNSVLPKDVVYFIERIQNKLPYFSSLNEAKLDQWGMENRKANVFAAAFENMVSPGYVKKLVTDDKVDNEIMRLYGEGVEENITPVTASRYLGQGDERKDLTSKEYHDYQETMGTLSYNILNNVVDEDWYQELNADEQAEYFGNVYDYAKTCARMEVEEDYEPTGTYAWVAKAINAQEEADMSIENYIRYKSEVTAYKGSLEGSSDEKKKQMISYIKRQKLDNKQNKVLWNMAGYNDSTFTTDFLGRKKTKK